MTRTIKVSEVRPGMEVQWTSLGITRRCTGEVVDAGSPRDGVNLRTSEGGAVHIPGDAEVTVLAEPQPEEPKAFGACVRMDGVGYIRDGVDDGRQYGPWFTPKFIDCSRNHRWEDLTARGQVEVVNPDPFARFEEAPEQATETPEVPERIEEWDTWDDVPEGVVVTVPGLFCHYRKNQGAIEFSDPDDDPEWTEPGVRAMPRGYGPWTRATDA